MSKPGNELDCDRIILDMSEKRLSANSGPHWLEEFHNIQMIKKTKTTSKRVIESNSAMTTPQVIGSRHLQCWRLCSEPRRPYAANRRKRNFVRLMQKLYMCLNDFKHTYCRYLNLLQDCSAPTFKTMLSCSDESNPWFSPLLFQDLWWADPTQFSLCLVARGHVCLHAVHDHADHVVVVSKKQRCGQIPAIRVKSKVSPSHP